MDRRTVLSKANSRALSRLRAAHKHEFQGYLAEEYTALGITVTMRGTEESRQRKIAAARAVLEQEGAL